MKIKSEWKLLEAITERIKWDGIKPPSDLVLSAGDDCSAFRINESTYGLLTTDISIENVHFKIGMISLEDIGYKVMTANISDITAMGGEPLYAVVSLGIPDRLSEEDVLALYGGFIEAANPAGVSITGGDISRAAGLIINIALYGTAARKQLVKRSGAGKGDIIYMTGTAGDSKAGLEIILSGDAGMMKQFPGLVEKHKRPGSRFNIIKDILNVFSPTSMIDISDGILSDLRHICEASSVGFEIFEANLPISKELAAYAEIKCEDKYNYALTGGEEYELLFTSTKTLADLMKLTINGISIVPVGKIIERGFFIKRGERLDEIAIDGFDHFREAGE